MTDAVALIKRRLSGLSNAGKRIGSYILAGPQRVTSMTLKELSRELSVSEGTIINFTSRMGFDGYTAMKLAIARSVTPGDVLRYAPTAPGDRAKDVIKRCTIIPQTLSEQPANPLPRVRSLKPQDCLCTQENISRSTASDRRAYS